MSAVKRMLEQDSVRNGSDGLIMDAVLDRFFRDTRKMLGVEEDFVMSEAEWEALDTSPRNHQPVGRKLPLPQRYSQ